MLDLFGYWGVLVDGGIAVPRPQVLLLENVPQGKTISRKAAFKPP